jgi:hypothetical protein
MTSVSAEQFVQRMCRRSSDEVLCQQVLRLLAATSCVPLSITVSMKSSEEYTRAALNIRRCCRPANVAGSHVSYQHSIFCTYQQPFAS